MTLIIRLVVLSCRRAAGSPARGQWRSVGDMPAASRIENGLLFRNAQGTVSVTAAAPDIVRLRFSPTREFGRDHSYAIVNRALGDHFRPAARSLALRVRWDDGPSRVTSTAASLTRYASLEELSTQATGWAAASDGFVHVKAAGLLRRNHREDRAVKTYGSQPSNRAIEPLLGTLEGTS